MTEGGGSATRPARPVDQRGRGSPLSLPSLSVQTVPSKLRYVDVRTRVNFRCGITFTRLGGLSLIPSGLAACCRGRGGTVLDKLVPKKESRLSSPLVRAGGSPSGRVRRGSVAAAGWAATKKTRRKLSRDLARHTGLFSRAGVWTKRGPQSTTSSCDGSRITTAVSLDRRAA